MDGHWYVLSWAGVVPLGLCRCWRWGVRMATGRSIRLTSVGNIKKLCVRGNSRRVFIPIFSLLELCKPDDSLRVGRNMPFHYHPTNKLVVFSLTSPIYFIVTCTTGMPHLKMLHVWSLQV